MLRRVVSWKLIWDWLVFVGQVRFTAVLFILGQKQSSLVAKVAEAAGLTVVAHFQHQIINDGASTGPTSMIFPPTFCRAIFRGFTARLALWATVQPDLALSAMTRHFSNSVCSQLQLSLKKGQACLDWISACK